MGAEEQYPKTYRKNYRLSPGYVVGMFVDPLDEEAGFWDEAVLLQVFKKWSSFGWDTFELDGHNIEELYNYFNKEQIPKKPKAIIANTIKGKGFTFSENNNDWHHAVMTKSLYDKAIEELKKV